MNGTLPISEIFRSIQGEGLSAGTPAHFVRLQGCTVGCAWCDTKYAWTADGGEVLTSDAVWARARALGPAPLLVVTGGEPLEFPGLPVLLADALTRWERVEVETSGIAPPIPDATGRLAWNVSPKLPSATGRWRETWAHAAAWAAEPRATFKIVVGDAPDPADAVRLIHEHALPRERVLLMPQGMTAAELATRSAAVAALCVEHGFRMSPRLHIAIWGARRGV
jgi:7-carboxy-7-deazaguanine synthase